MEYTITLKGSADAAGTAGVLEMTLGCYAADALIDKEGDDLELSSRAVDESLLRRRGFEIKFIEFSISDDAATPNYDTLEDLEALLVMPHKWITACNHPRWATDKGYSKLAALLPIKVIFAQKSRSLNEQKAEITYTATLKKQSGGL